MEKRYICFICYKHHPEMRGVSEEEFKAGNSVCQEKNCTCKGKPLEEAELCEHCDEISRPGEHKGHE